MVRARFVAKAADWLTCGLLPSGGFWNSVAFNDSARAQSWAPALNEDWNYDTDLIRGVNLGG